MRCIFATKLEVFLAATKYFIFLPLKEVFNKKKINSVGGVG